MKADIVLCGVAALVSVSVPLVNSAAVPISALNDDSIVTIALGQPAAATVTLPVTTPDGTVKILTLTYLASDATSMAIANPPETDNRLYTSPPAWTAAEKAIIVKHGVALGGFAATGTEAGEEVRYKGEEVEAMATTEIISKCTNVAHHSHVTESVKTFTLGHPSPASVNSAATCNPDWWGLLPEGVSVTPCSLTTTTHTSMV